MFALTFGTSLAISLLLVPAVRYVGIRLGRVSVPREDRWHRKSTPTLGGVAIFAATFAAILINEVISGGGNNEHIGLLVGASFIFFLGLYDDFRHISPPTKLIGQILAAAIVIYFGYTTNFFTPRIENTIVAQIPNIGLTFLWLVGITNAINLLDNMDGLAGGISFITAFILSFFFWQAGDTGLLAISLALAGGTLGFLVFNFPPASIFMGDSGSLYLGFSLAVLAIARQPQASNVFAIMGVPTLIFMLPILDTTLVTITRILRGQSPAQGGRDHTSHRLIAFGFNERQAVLLLYAVALVSGIAALSIERLEYWLSLLLVPLLVVSLALLTAYLGSLKIVSNTATGGHRTITRFIVELAYRRRLFEIILDLFLIGIAYYLAFLTYYRFSITATSLELILSSLPLAYISAYISFVVTGVYRPVWEYLGIGDFLNHFKATLGTIVLLVAAIAIFNSLINFPQVIFLYFAIFLFLGLAVTRSSFRILDALQSQRTSTKVERVLIYGAGNTGELAVRWIQTNPQFGFKPVGFLDDDPTKLGRQIHGIDILGGIEQLDIILERKGIQGLVIAVDAESGAPGIDQVIQICREKGCWVRGLKLDFELLEQKEPEI